MFNICFHLQWVCLPPDTVVWWHLSGRAAPPRPSRSHLEPTETNTASWLQLPHSSIHRQLCNSLPSKGTSCYCCQRRFESHSPPCPSWCRLPSPPGPDLCRDRQVTIQTHVLHTDRQGIYRSQVMDLTHLYSEAMSLQELLSCCSSQRTPAALLFWPARRTTDCSTSTFNTVIKRGSVIKPSSQLTRKIHWLDAGAEPITSCLKFLT